MASRVVFLVSVLLFAPLLCSGDADNPDLGALHADIEQIRSQVEAVGEDLDWQTTMYQLRSGDFYALQTAMTQIDAMGRKAIPKLLAYSFDTQRAIHRVSRTKDKKWGFGVVQNDEIYTVADVCIGIACELVAYPFAYSGPTKDKDEERRQLFREFTRQRLTEWWETHQHEPDVAHMSQSERSDVHRLWRKWEKMKGLGPESSPVPKRTSGLEGEAAPLIQSEGTPSD